MQSWLGEIVRYRGQLWNVTGIETSLDGLWLALTDHYGSGITSGAWASDVEVALQ